MRLAERDECAADPGQTARSEDQPHFLSQPDAGGPQHHDPSLLDFFLHAVWRHVRERQRTALLRSRLLAVAGRWQAKDGSTHLIARRLVDMTPWLGSLATSSRDFH